MMQAVPPRSIRDAGDRKQLAGGMLLALMMSGLLWTGMVEGLRLLHLF